MAFLTRKEYGELKGWSKQYISKLILNNRLVLDEAGRIDVEASEQNLETTRDPSKAGVSARHQQERLQRDVYSHVTSKSEPTNTAAPTPADSAQVTHRTFRKHERIASTTWRAWRRWSFAKRRESWWKSALCRRLRMKRRDRSINR